MLLSGEGSREPLMLLVSALKTAPDCVVVGLPLGSRGGPGIIGASSGDGSTSGEKRASRRMPTIVMAMPDQNPKSSRKRVSCENSSKKSLRGNGARNGLRAYTRCRAWRKPSCPWEALGRPLGQQR